MGWSQTELARRADIPRASLSAVETGRAKPSVDTALKLARCLGCSVEDLFAPAAPESAPDWAWSGAGQARGAYRAEVNGRTFWYPAEVLDFGPWTPDVGVQLPAALAAPPPATVVLASDDPLAGILVDALRRMDVRCLVFARTAARAERLLAHQRVHGATRWHAPPETPPPDPPGAVRCPLYDSRWGILLSPALRRAGADAWRAPQTRWLRGPRGGPDRRLWSTIGGAPAATDEITRPLDMGRAITAGLADAAMGTEGLAQMFGLAFVPLETLRLSLAVWPADGADRMGTVLQQAVRAPAVQAAWRAAGASPVIDTAPSN